jgi:anti-anti-sigma regulatory factor
MEELILLSESLEISTVAACREEWQKTLITPQPTIRLVIDRLNKIDTAGVQLLLAFKKDAIGRGKKFLISGQSEALRSQTDILGLSAFLLDETGKASSVTAGSGIGEPS